MKAVERKYYNPKIDPNMRWFPRPNEKCSGEFYEKKDKLFVNWFRFAQNICGQEYFEYSVDMYKEKVFRDKRGQQKKKTMAIAIPNRPALFWQHLRNEKEILSGKNQKFNIEDNVFDDRDTMYTVNMYGNSFSTKMTTQESKDVTYVLKLELRKKFRPYFSREDPTREEEVNRSFRFLKNVMTQKVRYSPDQRDTASLEFSRNFVYDNNAIHRVPDSFHDPNYFFYNSLEIAPKIEAWFGLFLSVRELSNGQAVLSAGLIDRLFYNAPNMSLLDYLLLAVDKETYQDDKRNQRKEELKTRGLSIDPKQIGRVEQILKDIRLKCAKVWDNNRSILTERHLTFVELHTDNSERTTFLCGRGRDARRVPICEIYNNNHEYVQFPKLQLAVVKSGANEYLVPLEHLFVHEKPQRFRNSLDRAMLDKFINQATRKPHEYGTQTLQLLEQLDLPAEELNFVQHFGMSPELKMIECQGKVLNEPMLVNKENKKIKMTPVVRGFQEKRLNVVPEKQLCCALFVLRDEEKQRPCVGEEQAREFYTELIDGCQFRSMRIGNDDNRNARSLLKAGEKYAAYYDCTLFHGAAHFSAAADDALDKFKSLPDKDDKILLFIVISNPASNAYQFVKYYCDTHLGIASQHVKSHTVEKLLAQVRKSDPSRRIVYQLALKINTKLDGVNQELDYSERAEMSPEEKERRKTMPLRMYVGIDVTHPSPGSGIDYSIASIVASVDAGGYRYRHLVVTQEMCRPNERPVAHGIERTDILEGKFKKLLKIFAENNNNRCPDHIVIYRDGVSDSEMLRVSHDELKSLRNEVQMFLDERSNPSAGHPKYTFIVVQKRHRTRFLRQIEGENVVGEEMFTEKRIGNPVSGTVVDKKVVAKYKFEFYLASHNGDKGTSRPAHYTVMFDDAGLSQDLTYKMTYELSFLSGRCRKPISIPAPVHYAHLACEKAKENFRALKRQEILERPVIRRDEVEQYLQTSPYYPGMSFV